MKWKPTGLVVVALALLLLALSSSPASAAEVPGSAWSIEGKAKPTDLTPGATGVVNLLATNTGAAATSEGEVTITDDLPNGLVPLSAFGRFRPDGIGFPCSTAGQLVTCTYEGPPVPGDLSAGLFVQVEVEVEPTAPLGPVSNLLTISGGGAAAATSDEAIAIGPEVPLFGIDGAFGAAAFAPSGALATQAGSHPSSLSTSFILRTVRQNFSPGTSESPQEIRDAVVELPPGLVGNPLAAPTCPQYLVAPPNEGVECPAASIIGSVAAIATANGAWNFSSTEPASFIGPLYNVPPERGYPAEFAFTVGHVEVAIYASVAHTPRGYVIRATAPSISTALKFGAARVTLFGNPSKKDGGSIPSKAFFSLPSDCNAGPPTTLLHLDSWQSPGSILVDGTPNFADPAWLPAVATSPPVSGCERLQFAPKLTLAPSTTAADSPAGLSVDLTVPQNEDAEGLATPPLRQATVILPKGMAVNPSSANGLTGCAPAQVAAETTDPGTCPEASQIGEVEVKTPLLNHPLPGKVFLGTPECAPCSNADAQGGKLIKLYIEVDDPISGVVLKLPGSGTLDPATGRITASFKENPQLPFEDLNLTLKGGPRATLTTPPMCGHYTTTADLEPWSAPQSGPDATPSSEFDLTSGPGGSACASSEAGLPNKPGFEAGTTTPIAGAYSPFVLKLSREDGSQRISSIDTTLPEGLLGKLAGIPYCPDAAIVAAAGSSGAAERAAPSCPPASEVGTVNVGAGSGTPFYVQGHAYLAGPYKGAPLSLAIITPAVAGPFDLGTVVVRTALFVNETTAQIHAVSDPIPAVLAGIPLDLRSIALEINRPSFTLNPTSCDPKQILGSATSTLGNVAPLSQRFQVGGCKGLEFKPALKLAFSGQTKRTGFPALKAVLTQPQGQNANVSGATVILPKGMLIANAHISNPCTRVQFNSGKLPGEGCPAKSILGSAKVWTPLLEAPEEGKVYFRSNGGERELPDLAVALRGQIPLQLVGFIDSVGRKGAEVRRVRSRFLNLPDAPVSRFELKLSGGKKGLLQNSKNLCEAKNLAKFQLTGQNGKTYDSEPAVQVSCGKNSKGRQKPSKSK